jgi:hypothetical protein
MGPTLDYVRGGNQDFTVEAPTHDKAAEAARMMYKQGNLEAFVKQIEFAHVTGDKDSTTLKTFAGDGTREYRYTVDPWEYRLIKVGIHAKSVIFTLITVAAIWALFFGAWVR